jgi:23S rRNA (pseudouridine1915-N3)-methyltransferase
VNLGERDPAILIRIIEANDLHRRQSAKLFSILQLGLNKITIPVVVPSVEFFQKPYHLALHWLGIWGACHKTGCGKECYLIHCQKRLACGEGLGKFCCMRFRIIVAGKPALPYAKAAVDDYLKRLGRHGNYDLVIVRAGDREDVSARLLAASDGCHRIALDERGESPDTRSLSLKLNALEMAGEVKTVAFLIGAADGHSSHLREACDMILSLSGMTLQHELALVVLLEQLYRLACIKSGSPYHRD